MFGAPSLPKTDYGQLWSTYKSWVADTGSLYDNRVAGAKARMASSGSRVTDDEWGETIAGIEAEREKELQSLKDTTTFKALERGYQHWLNPVQARGINKNALKEERSAISFEDYYGEQYGPMEVGGTQEPPAETSTTAIQEEEERPGMTITADLYSPWMEKV